MKVRKKRKEAEREGEASAIMVSQSALPAPSLFEGAFWGMGPASARQQGFTLIDTLKKKDEINETGRERGSRGDLACVLFYSVNNCKRLGALFTHHWRVR